MMTEHEQKTELREKICIKRDALTPDEIMEKSNRIMQKLFATKEFMDANKIMFYSSCNSEVRTMEMIEESLGQGKEVILPIVNIRKKNVKLVKIKITIGLKPNKLVIPEPSSNNLEEINPADLDMIVAPGIAFTANCERLGAGWGFFDQMFEKTNAKRVGICFDIQVTKEVPMESHDKSMDILITESGAYRRGLTVVIE